MNFLVMSAGLFEALNVAGLHSHGRCGLRARDPDQSDRHLEPLHIEREAAHGHRQQERNDPWRQIELEWFHCVVVLPCEHLILLVGPTGAVRITHLDETDLFPCDVDTTDPSEREYLWRLWRRARTPHPKYASIVITALNRLRNLAKQVA